MTPHKLGFIETKSGERENAYKDLKAAVDSFNFLHVHRRKLSKYTITVFQTSILRRIKNEITAKVKYTTKVKLKKLFLGK